MKLVAFAICLLLCDVASARRVVHFETLDEICPPNAQWEPLLACIGKQGKATVMHETAETRLVLLAPQSRFAGLYLYRRADRWLLVGQMRVADPDVLVLEANDALYRIDVGEIGPSILGDDNQPILVKRTFTMLCPKREAACSQLTTACDVFSRGRAISAYRGRPTVIGSKMHITGDALTSRSCGTSPVDQDIVIR